MLNSSRYNFNETEKKWQIFWEKNNSFKVEKNIKKKSFIV